MTVRARCPKIEPKSLNCDTHDRTYCMTPMITICATSIFIVTEELHFKDIYVGIKELIILSYNLFPFGL